MMPAHPTGARHGDSLPFCSPPLSCLVDVFSDAQLPPHPAPHHTPPRSTYLCYGGLGSTRLPQARPMLGTKVKVGSDAEWEPGPPCILLAPGEGGVGL